MAGASGPGRTFNAASARLYRPRSESYNLYYHGWTESIFCVCSIFRLTGRAGPGKMRVGRVGRRGRRGRVGSVDSPMSRPCRGARTMFTQVLDTYREATESVL